MLKPVYEFVKGRKAAAGSDVSGWIYTKWANTSLDIELIKGTSILSVAYRDADESLILPVLRKITNTYQTYSGKDRRRGLNQGIDYLKQEIEKLGQQSAASMRAAQAYALANGLGIQDGCPQPLAIQTVDQWRLVAKQRRTRLMPCVSALMQPNLQVKRPYIRPPSICGQLQCV